MFSFSDRVEMPKHVLRFLEKESELLIWKRTLLQSG